MTRKVAEQTIRAIVKELDGHVWSPDTLDRIAGHLRRAGFEVREPESEKHEDAQN